MVSVDLWSYWSTSLLHYMISASVLYVHTWLVLVLVDGWMDGWMAIT